MGPGAARHLIAIAVLPFSVTVLIPMWLARRYAVDFLIAGDPPQIIAQIVGALLVATGLFFFTTSLYEFATRGRGTLAPWDAPRRLVMHGPYRYVRNPMIAGVLLIVLGEAFLLLSLPHAAWAGSFFAANAVYIPLVEEPQLRRRFGPDYIDYCRRVPRLLPRLGSSMVQGNS
jgi:protein-S-isoprenylcysteine O-methyltransferase Ste14